MGITVGQLDVCGFASNSIYYSKVMSERNLNCVQNSSFEFCGEDGFVNALKCMEE